MWKRIDAEAMSGKRVLLYCPEMDGEKEVIARYKEDASRPYIDRGNITKFPWVLDDGGLIEATQPTRYIPLPPPPEKD